MRRLERERRTWTRRPDHGRPVVPTEVAWRAGVAEGLRLAQAAIRQGGLTMAATSTGRRSGAPVGSGGRTGRPWPGSPSSGQALQEVGDALAEAAAG